MARSVAVHVAEQAKLAISARGSFYFALSGGATPKLLYQRLANVTSVPIEWPRVHVFWGDERCVRPDQSASNYRMAREALLGHVPLPPANIHRIHGEDEPKPAAAAYETLLRRFFGDAGTGPPETSFDLVLLGMGADGHTASIFPNRAASRETHRWVVACPGPRVERWRVTLTPALFNAAGDVTFLVTGASKAERLREVLEERAQRLLPAQLIRPTHGALHWMIDADAAAQLRGDTFDATNVRNVVAEPRRHDDTAESRRNQ